MSGEPGPPAERPPLATLLRLRDDTAMPMYQQLEEQLQGLIRRGGGGPPPPPPPPPPRARAQRGGAPPIAPGAAPRGRGLWGGGGPRPGSTPAWTA